MSADIIPPEEFARRRAERQRQRRERQQPFTGSILHALTLLDDEPDPPRAPASPSAPKKETRG